MISKTEASDVGRLMMFLDEVLGVWKVEVEEASQLTLMQWFTTVSQHGKQRIGKKRRDKSAT